MQIGEGSPADTRATEKLHTLSVFLNDGMLNKGHIPPLDQTPGK